MKPVVALVGFSVRGKRIITENLYVNHKFLVWNENSAAKRYLPEAPTEEQLLLATHTARRLLGLNWWLMLFPESHAGVVLDLSFPFPSACAQIRAEGGQVWGVYDRNGRGADFTSIALTQTVTPDFTIHADCSITELNQVVTEKINKMKFK